MTTESTVHRHGLQPISATAYYDAFNAQAEGAFAKHVIRETRDNGHRYALYSRNTDDGWEANFCAEIIVIRGGLFVGGDSPDCIFRWFSDSRDAKAHIQWIGGHPKTDSYVAGKARIGMGHEITEAVEPAVLLYDLKREIDDYRRDNDEAMPIKRRRTIDQAMGAVARCDEDMSTILRRLSEAHEDNNGEFISRLGRVPNPRVFFAHAAVRRLWCLICACEPVSA